MRGNCANCRQQWFNPINGPDQIFVQELLGNLKRLTNPDLAALGVTIRLQIASSSKP